MSGNEARVYEGNEMAVGGWMDGAIIQEAPTSERAPDIGGQVQDEAESVIRLRLCLRARSLPGPYTGKIEAAGRKRGKRTPPEAAQDRSPPPRPRIVWRREDEAETRPPPAIIME